jgi:aspartate aminotransferase
MNSNATVRVSDFRPASRLQTIEVSEILRIGAAANRLRQQGRPVILLGAGEPDFDTPDNVKRAAESAMRRGLTKYTALDGTAELKAAIAAKFKRDNGLSFEASEITVGAGAKQVIFNAMVASLNEGDEVILVAPYWTTYADMVRIAGGRPIVVVGREQDDFRLQPEDLQRAITERTRWLFLNSPSNPGGATYTAEQLRPLLDVLKRHRHVWLLADDIYEHLVYDDQPFATAAQVEPELAGRILTVNGVSKAYAMTGWRVGYGGGPAELIAAIATVQSQSTSNACSISQAAAVEALSGPQDILVTRRAAFQRRRDLVLDHLADVDGVVSRRPQGAFYLFASCAGLFGRRTPAGQIIGDDVDFCRYLLDRHDVAVVPGSCFGVGSYFRLSYAASEQDLKEACERIRRACEALS